MSKRSFFVSPDETVTLNLGNDLEGEWIEVKRKLNYGDEKVLSASGLRSVVDPGSDKTEIGVDWARTEVERLVMWITEWSFIGPDGKRAKVTRDNIRMLEPDVAKEINRVLDDYIESQKDSKKAPKPSNMSEISERVNSPSASG